MHLRLHDGYSIRTRHDPAKSIPTSTHVRTHACTSIRPNRRTRRRSVWVKKAMMMTQQTPKTTTNPQNTAQTHDFLIPRPSTTSWAANDQTASFSSRANGSRPLKETCKIGVIGCLDTDVFSTATGGRRPNLYSFFRSTVFTSPDGSFFFLFLPPLPPVLSSRRSPAWPSSSSVFYLPRFFHHLFSACIPFSHTPSQLFS